MDFGYVGRGPGSQYHRLISGAIQPGAGMRRLLGKGMHRENVGWDESWSKSSVRCRKGRSLGSGAGFSLIELLVVVAILLITVAFAIPTLRTTLDSYRMRGTLSSAANLAQRCRSQAIKRNITQHMHFATVGNRVVLFVTDIDDTVSVTAPTTGEISTADPKLSAVLWLPSQFALAAAPTGIGAPTQLTGSLMWGTSLNPNVGPQDPYFSSRGMPCLPDPVTTACNPTNGFVYYFTYQRGTTNLWAATSISPAGRIESWFWNGTSWGN